MREFCRYVQAQAAYGCKAVRFGFELRSWLGFGARDVVGTALWVTAGSALFAVIVLHIAAETAVEAMRPAPPIRGSRKKPLQVVVVDAWASAIIVPVLLVSDFVEALSAEE